MQHSSFMKVIKAVNTAALALEAASKSALQMQFSMTGSTVYGSTRSFAFPAENVLMYAPPVS